ncbi:MAG: hypothetical protein Q9195_000310 [Heterodermia aff. obscurata]
MVRLTITPALVTAINAIRDGHLDLTVTDGEIDSTLGSPKVGDPITHRQILAVSKSLKRQIGVSSPVPFHLDELLRGSRIYNEPPEPKAGPTSEYKALMSRLRREEEARAYERMINPPLPIETFRQRFPNSASPELFVPSQTDIGEDEEMTYADINRQMALIINVLVSIVACSVAIWLAARHWSTPSRLGLSMGGSGMVGLAEVAVYAGYIRRVKDARDKGKKLVESKEIVKTWVIGGEEQKITTPITIASDKAPTHNIRRRAV